MRTGRLAAFFLVVAAWLAGTPAFAQVCPAPGSTGPQNVAGIVNTYYPGAGTAFAGSLSIPVGAIDGRGAATPIAAGDLLLVIQMQDASINSTNTASYGGSGGGQGYTSLNSAGLYEYAVAAGPVSGGVVPLAAPLANTYTTAAANATQGQRRYQVIRVPQYSNATLTGTVTAPEWNGDTGGIVAFDVAGTLNWNSQTVDVSGRGFRGGGAQCSTSGFGANTDYRTSSAGRTINLAGTGNNPNGTKGEGVAGTPILVFTPTTPNDNSAGTITTTTGADGTTGGYPSGSFGRGAPGNAGGGGTDGNPTANDQNSGGGGGGNYGIGGKGGFGWTPGTPPGADSGGFGGMSMPVAPARLFFGGGGGSGSTNNCTGTPANGRASSGAAGGGLVLIRAKSTSGAGTVAARGTHANNTVTNDASGGGGAGGAVLVFVDNGGAPVGATIDIRGGNGGSNTGGGSPHGPGGGGSGGYAALSGTATVLLTGGANGTTATSATTTADYGSTSSVGGFNLVNLGPAQIPGAGVPTACFPVLTVTKTTSTPYVSAGQPATYTITVANQAGKGTAETVRISDALPANPDITYATTTSVVLAGGATRPATVTPSPAPPNPTPLWGDFRIPGGGSVAITFTANVAASVVSGVYQNPATVTYLDPTRTAAQTVTPGGTYTAGGTVPGSNYASGSSTAEDITVVNPPPSFAKSFSPAAVTPGATSVMTVVVTNPNAIALTNAGFTDNYPPGLVNTAAPSGASSCGGTVAAAAGGATLTLSGATIPASGSCTVTVNVTTTANGSYTNTLPAASLANTQGITNTAAASATLYSTVTVAKSFSPTAIAPGADATLSLVITNPNTVALSLANPGLTDNFPPNLRASGGAVTVTGAGCTGFAPATIAANATSLVLTAGTLPAGGSCTVSLLVTSTVTGTYNNTTSGVSTTTGTTGPPSNTASLGVGLVNIAKNFSPSQIAQGGTTTLTYTLTNPTGIPQTGGQFLDTLINMQVSGNQSVGGTCTGVTPANVNNGDTLLSFTGISIPAGSCTITVVLTSSVIGTHPNAANGVTTSTLPQGPGSNTDYLTVVGKPAIAKAFSPASVPVGGASTLTFTITNPNTIALTGLAFTDAYPAGIVNATPLAVGGTCAGVATTATAGGASFDVTAGSVAANTSCTITVGVVGQTAGAWSNTASGVASAQSGSAGAGSNTATLTVSSPPTITKAFGTSPIAQGGTSLITFTLANPNATPLTNLRFTDALVNMAASSATIGGTCAGTTSTPALVAGATFLDLTVPSLGGGANCTITVTVTSSVSGTHPNTTSGVTTTQTPAAGAPSNTASLTVLSPPSLQKNFVPGTIEGGGSSSIVFTVSNPQATALANVTFSDPLFNMALAAGAAVTETCSGVVTPAGVANGSTNFTLTLNSLAAGETCTMTVGPVTSAVASPAAGHANTTSAISSAQTAVNPGAPATGYLRVLLPPVITKSFAPAFIATGGTSTVTFTLTNPNAVALSDVRFTDDLPANLSNNAAQTFVGSGRGTCTGTIPSAKATGLLDPITFASTNLPANSSCTILMDVTSGTAGAYTNTVTNVSSDQTPTATTGGSDVLTVGALGINKRFCSNLPAATPGASTCSVVSDVEVGSNVYLWIQITNNSGTSNVNDLYFNDTLPAGMQTVAGDIFVSRNTGQCDESPNPIPNEAGGSTTFNFNAGRHLDDLDAGSSCIVSVLVTGTTAGTKDNTVTGTNPAALNGRTDTASIRFWQAPTITKAFAPATIGAGATSTVTITLTNPAGNPGALTNASFSDTLSNMAVAANQSVGGTCAGTTPAALTGGQTGAIAFSGITIPQGGSCTVTFTVTSTNLGVNPNATTGVTSTQTPSGGAASAVANLTVVGTALTKAFSPATITAGTVSRLTFTLSNGAGNPAQPNLAFTETLPANVVVASPANAATTCTGGSVSATAGGGTIALSGASLAAGEASCTVGVDVTSAVAGTYDNLPANISGLSPGLSAAGLSATLTVNAAASLTKAFTPASIAPGSPATLAFIITNGAGNPAQTGLAFTDTFPGNVVVAASPNVTTNCPAGGGFAPPAFTVSATAGSGAVSVSGLSLNAGVASCEVRVSVTATALGSYNNNATNISGLAGGLTAGGVNATLSAVGTSLTKSFNPTVIGKGGVSTMTFVIANGGGNPAQSGLQFTENLPANLFVAPVPNLVNTCGGTVTATAGAGTIPFSGGSLAAGVPSCSFSVDVTSSFVGTYVNPPGRVLNASSTMDISGVNATLAVLENVEVAKAFSPATIPAGAPSVLTITLANVNGTPITGVAFTDTYAGAIVNTATPAGATTCAGGTVTAAAGAGSVSLSGGTVPAFGSCTVTVNVTGGTPGAQGNTLAAGAVTSSNAGANSAPASATLTVVARPVVSKAYAPAEIGVGGTSTLTITLANANAATAITGVAFTDTQPANVTTVAATAATTCGGTASQTANSVSLSGGTIPAGGSCTVTVNVTSATVGAHANTIAAGDVTSANAGANDAAANATLTVLAAPTVAKAFSPASIYPNGTSLLTITLTNPNATPVTGVAFTDSYPGSMVNTATPGGATTCPGGTVTAAPSGTSVALSGATIPAGGSCTVTVNVTGNAVGVTTNSTGPVTTANAGTAAAATADLTVVGGLASTKLFTPISIAAGGTSTLTITLTNPNTTTALTGVAFTDNYPAAITNSATPGGATTCPGGTVTAAPGGASLALSGATLAAGASCAVTVEVTSSTGGTHVNAVGTITAANAPSVVGDSTVLFVYAPPTLAKSFTPSTIGPGGTSTLRLVIANPAGNPASALTGLVATDPLGTYAMSVASPTTATFTPAACGTLTSRAAVGSGGFGTLTAGHQELRLDVASLSSGTSCQVDVEVTSSTPGTANNTTAAPTATGPVALTGSAASATLTVTQPTLTKGFAAGTIADGGSTSLVFTLANGPGSPAQSGIGFTDTLPSGLAFSGASPALTYSAGCSGPVTGSYVAGTRVLTLSGIAMAGGTASCTVTVAGLANAATRTNPSCPAADFTNGASAIGALANVFNGVTDQCLVVTRLDPSLTKAFSPATIDQGAVSTLVFTITNSGTNPAQSGIGFTDTLPAGVLVASPPSIATSCPSGTGAVTAPAGAGAIAVAGATLAAGQASCTISVNVTAASAGVYANTSANIAGAANITATGASASLTVLPLPSLTKAFSPSTVGTGQNAVLTFTISNLAGGPARSGLAFTDALPAGLEIGTPAGVASTCGGSPAITATPGTGVFSVGGAGVDASAGPSTCTIAVNVTGNAPGTYVNGAAQVTAVTGLLNAVTDQALTVLARPTVAKAFGAASIAPGGATTLTVTLSNANAVPLTGVAFTDVLPVAPGSMTLANATAANTCGGTLTDNGGGALNAGDAGIQLAGGTIPASGSCTVTVNVTASTPGTYTNTLAAGAVTTANAASSTAPASASLLVTAPPTIAKAFSPAIIAADGTSTITFTLANPNAIALTAGAFTDTLADMAIAASGNAGGTCAGAGGNALTAGQTALSFTGITIPANGSCTVTVVVASDIPGVHGNQASGVATAEAATGAASNVANLTVDAAAPTIAKAFSPATIAADGTSTITFTVANTNGVALTSAGFTDNLVNMAVEASGTAGGTCAGAASNSLTAGQANLTLSNLTIPANGSCTVTVVVRSDVPGAHPNTASGVTSAQAPTGAASNTATLTVTAVAPTIAKAFSPSTIAAGATSTITFTLANTLGIPLTAGAFTDSLVNMAIAATGAAGGTCAGAASNSFTAGQTALSFTGLTVPPNGSCTVTVVVLSNVPGTHSNTTSVLDTAEAPDSAVSNTASLTVTAVAPSIAKAFSPASITADGTATVTLTILNPQGIPLTAASFTDTLAGMVVAANGAAGGTCAGAGGNFLTAGQSNVAITGLTIPAAAGAIPGSCTVTFVVTGDVPGTYPNQASGVASTEAPSGAPSNIASLAIVAAPPTIAKAFAPAGIPVFSTSTITFTLGNTNGIALTGASFNDTLASMAVNATGPAGGTCAGAASNSFTAGATGLLAFSGLTIPANGTCTVTLVVTSSVIGTHPNATSGVASNEAATGAGSNTANLTVQPLPPTISKAFSPTGILAGGTTTLTVTVGNPNPSGITITSVTDNLPAGVVVAAAPAASTTCSGGTLDDGAGALNGGDTAIRLTGGTVNAGSSCTFQVNVTAPTFGVYVNTIPVGGLTTSGGFNTSAATATLTVDPVADLAVIKNAPASIGAGQILNYTVSVVNNGPDPANLAQFADTVPAPITGVSAVCGAATGGAVCGTVNVAGNAVTSTITTLPAGASVTFTISGTATGLGASTNTATITAPAGVFDPVAANNSSSATTTVLAPDLTITKTHAGSFTVGVNGTYTITVGNGLGSLATSGVVTVVDTLPAGLAYVSAAGTGWSCSAAGQVVTCTTASPIAAGASAPAISLVVAVSSTAMPSVLNTVTVSGGGEPAAATNNNTATDNTIVVAAAVNAFAPDGARTGMPGTVVFYPHTFNAGLAGSVAFATSSVPMPSVPGWSQTIYRDTNCNGALDGAEGAVPLSGAVAVNPGDAVCIIVRDSIPGAAPYNAQNAITVTATFNGSQTYTRNDLTTVGAAAGAGLTLAKTVRNVTQGGAAATSGTAKPDDILEYAITFTNTGAGPVSAIVIADATPAFTLFQSAACPMAPLPASLTACGVTAQPAVNGTGSVVWTLTGSLLSGGSGSVTYQVRVSN